MSDVIQTTVLPYQEKFIDFLVKSGALTFGDFVTKSGRKTPYFVNTGNFNTGEKIASLGEYYASHIAQHEFPKIDTIFGPAYKGIPLCVTTSIALSRFHGMNVGFTFDRKEAKDHGDKGTIVGHQLKDGDSLIIVEDVITAGTTLREIIPLIKRLANVTVLGVVIAVDRAERGAGTLSAVQEASETLGIQVFPIVAIHHILEHLSQPNQSGMQLNEEMQKRIRGYLEEYGAKK